MTTYNSYGTTERHSNIPADAPEGALAYKFTDSIEDARWVTDADELSRLRFEDAPLTYTAAGLEALGVEVE